MTASGWVLMWSFLSVLNPDFNHRGTMTAANAEQCAQRMEEMCVRLQGAQVPPYMNDIQISIVCRNRRNQNDFRTINCERK